MLAAVVMEMLLLLWIMMGCHVKPMPDVGMIFLASLFDRLHLY
jgi:hypothetical protein